jgi:hypothetical protein
VLSKLLGVCHGDRCSVACPLLHSALLFGLLLLALFLLCALHVQ